MTDNNRIDVQYDNKTNIPSPLHRGSKSFETNLSGYFYDKQDTIVKDSIFDDEDVRPNNDYGLSSSNGDIDISTTPKLIKYLKALIRKNVESLTSSINEKLNISDYIIDDDFKSDSINPLQNKKITEKINTIVADISKKANIVHTHNMNEISSLQSNIDSISNNISSKANQNDLLYHTSNKDNPHHVTLKQLGIDDTGWDDSPYTENSFNGVPGIYARRYGKLVIFYFNGELYGTFKKNTKVLTLKSEFRPDHYIPGIAYNIGEGTSFTYSIDKSGVLKFGATKYAGDKVRIYDCFFVK